MFKKYKIPIDEKINFIDLLMLILFYFKLT